MKTHRTTKKMKYEYTVRRPDENFKTIISGEESFLDLMGMHGWELCCVLDADKGRRVYYFRRVIDETVSSTREDENDLWLSAFADVNKGLTSLVLKRKYKLIKR